MKQDDASLVTVKHLSAILFFFFLLSPTALALVNINTATPVELQSLNGIGAVKAQAIIDYRNSNGAFSSIEDIQNVSGIGPATYESIKNDITVDGQTSVETSSSTNTGTTSEANSSSSSVLSRSSTKDKEIQKPVGGLNMKIPGHAFVEQVVRFDVDPLDGTDGRLVRYSWNFGDGHTADFKNPTHRYRYPGTYVVVVESYYLKSTKLQRAEILVLPVKIRLEKQLNGAVKLTNESDYEIDLEGLVLTGENEFTFQEHTVLLPQKSLVVGPESLISKGQNVSLRNQLGRVVSSSDSPSEEINVTQVTSRNTTTQVSSRTPYVPPTVITEENKEDEVATTSEYAGQQAAVGSAPVSKEVWPYLALLLVVGLGIFALLGTQKPQP